MKRKQLPGIRSLLLFAMILSLTATLKAQGPIDPTGQGCTGVGSMALSVVGTNLLFFGAEDGSTSFDFNLWKYDGASSQKILKISTITANPYPSQINEAYGKGYFFVDDNVHGYQPWVTDGTAAGTFMLGNIMSSSSSNFASGSAFIAGRPINFVGYNGKVYFAADNGSTNGNELWVTNGTTAGTSLFMDLYPGFHASDPGNFIVSNGLLYFTAKNSSTVSFWKTDGTVSGTSVITLPAGVSLASPVFKYKNKFVFAANTSNIRGSVYITDGTTFTMIKDSLAPSVFDTVNGKLVFGDRVSLFDSTMYVSDGTHSGTVKIKNSIVFSNPEPLGNKLFFSGTTAINGLEPWVTDGTAAGTMMLKDVVAGTSGSGITSINGEISPAIGGKVFFTILNASYQAQLWETDGTMAGTKMTADIHPGGNAALSFYTVFNNALYFVANGPASNNKTKIYKLGGLSGVNHLDKKPEVSVYPNPSQGIFYLQTEKAAQIEVYDVAGKKVLETESSKGLSEINLGAIVNGIYLLKVTDSNNNSVIQRIVKSN